MIRRALTGNDVRPLTNGERKALWANKYHALDRTPIRLEEERTAMLGIVCSYCGAVSDSPVFDTYGRRYCCTQHRILGETDPYTPTKPKRDDEEDQAARGATGSW